MNQTIIDPKQTLPSKHTRVIEEFTHLLIDLKLQILAEKGQILAETPHDPITMDRLNDLTRLLATLSECQDDSFRIKY